MFRRKIVIHTTIAIISFVILSSVQFFLLYNTYELKNEHYGLTTAALIEKTYGHSISDDKVYPGGAQILDHYINGNMDSLAHTGDTDALKRRLLLIGDSIIAALQKNNNLDSVFEPLHKNPRIGNMDYGLFLTNLEVSIDGTNYYPLYVGNESSPWGLLIGGKLTHPATSNAIGSLSIGSGMPRSYRIRTQLFAETADRRSAIIRLMLPTFLLSVLSILSVTVISFLAFRNWVKQKHLSEMKSDFINSITHEFNTPLATIILANRTLSNPLLTAHIEQILPLSSVIERQTDRLKTMISRVLDITTMARIIPDLQALSMHRLLEQIIQDYRVKLANAGSAAGAGWTSKNASATGTNASGAGIDPAAIANISGTNAGMIPSAGNTGVNPSAANTGINPSATNNSGNLPGVITGVNPSAANTGVNPSAANTGVNPSGANTGVHPSGAHAGVDITLIPAAHFDMIMADNFWFTTIVLNLLDNAIKYNDKTHKSIVVSTRSTRKYLVMEVHDNGSGMDASTRKHIFEKFYRAPDQVKKESKGLGLGLYYVQMAVIAHHWKIQVDSKPGQGSTFSIFIPY